MLHPVFHVSLLKPNHGDIEDPTRGESKRAPSNITTSHDHDVDIILARQLVPRRGMHPSYVEYLVKWKNRPDSEASWEREVTLWELKEKITQFLEEYVTRASPNSVGENVMGRTRGLNDVTDHIYFGPYNTRKAQEESRKP